MSPALQRQSAFGVSNNDHGRDALGRPFRVGKPHIGRFPVHESGPRCSSALRGRDIAETPFLNTTPWKRGTLGASLSRMEEAQQQCGLFFQRRTEPLRLTSFSRARENRDATEHESQRNKTKPNLIDVCATVEFGRIKPVVPPRTKTGLSSSFVNIFPQVEPR